MELDSQNIGKLIKQLRIRAGLTQNELAERIGVGNKAVSKWEQGRGIPDISLLYRLSLELDEDIESILAGNLANLGSGWVGVIYAGDAAAAEVAGRPALEYLISMFLLAGIRDIAVISAGDGFKLLEQYQEKGILRQIWCAASPEELSRDAGLEEKHVCFLYRPAFLYGMHLTRYMRREMLRKKPSVLALRQGNGAYMSEICFDNSVFRLSVNYKNLAGSRFYLFPMVFGGDKPASVCLEKMRRFTDGTVNAGIFSECFKTICAEPVDRGMLAFSFQTEKDRKLAGRILSGIEESQDIHIGDLREIMAVRGWKI